MWHLGEEEQECDVSCYESCRVSCLASVQIDLLSIPEYLGAAVRAGFYHLCIHGDLRGDWVNVWRVIGGETLATFLGVYRYYIYRLISKFGMGFITTLEVHGCVDEGQDDVSICHTRNKLLPTL